jgi:hypothetical protein
MKTIQGTDVSSIFPKAAILEKAQYDEINNGLQGYKDMSIQMKKAGADDATILSFFYNGLGNLKTTVRPLNDLAAATDQLEKVSKDTPGMIWKNVDKNYRQHVLENEDGTSKRGADVFKDGKNAMDVIDDVVNGYDDNYDNGAFRASLLKSKGVLNEQEFTKRDKAGNETKIKKVSDVPSTAYRYEETTQGDRPVVDGKQDKFSDDKLAAVFHTVVGDNGIGNDISVMKDPTIGIGYMKSYPGADGYIKQETRKFIKEAAKNGIEIMDPNGDIKPEYQQDIDKFQQAVTYNAFDDLAPIVGGFKTKGGLPGKGDVISQKAPPTQHPSQTTIIKQQQETANKKSFYGALDEKTKDTDGHISIQEQFAGIKDKQGLEYGKYGDLTLGWDKNAKKWKVRVYESTLSGARGPLKSEMSLDAFVSSHPTMDPTKSDDAQFINLQNWAADHTPKSGKTGKLNNPQ